MARNTSDVHVVVATAAGVAVSVLGLVAVLGWIASFSTLVAQIPDVASVQVEAAFGLMLVGITLVCLATRGIGWVSRVANICATAIASLAVLQLVDHVLEADVYVLPPPAASDELPLLTVTCFLLYGAAAFLVHRERWRLAFVTIVSLGVALSLMMIVGYFYGATFLYRPAQVTFIAVCGNIALFGAFIGLAALEPNTGWVALTRSRGPGGTIGRTLIPVIVVLLPVIGALKLKGQHAGLYDTESGVAMFVTTAVVSFVALIWFVGKRVDLLDERARANEERYRQVVDEIHEGIWIHADRRIVFANAYAAEVFGAQSPRDLVGRSVFDLVHEDDRDRVANRIDILYDEDRPIEPTELRMVRLDKKIIVVDIHSMRITLEGRRYVMSTGHDVTTQREAERQLQRSQRMEAVGQLTNGVAHEFNNLLTIIMGNAELLAENLVEDARKPDLGRAILEAASHGSDLTERLMAFSLLRPLDARRIDVNAFILKLQEGLQRSLGGEMELIVRPGEDLWPLAADPTHVESALLNLLTNARDAMSSGGKVTIETANAHLDEVYAAGHPGVTSGDYVMMTVTDTGTGMPPDVLAHAFEPFFTTKEVGKGTGLGLSVIYGFAKQSGGHVTIHSEVGRGTDVRLYLPRAKDSDKRPHA